MRLLIIDNNDSFTFNIVDMVRAIKESSAEVIKSISLSLETLKRFDHIIISPGPMKPADFPILKDVIAFCLHNNTPLLGICLGHQAIGEYFGGELINLKAVVHGQKKRITIDNSSKIYQNLPNKIDVGLYHSWAINHANLPNCLKATGISPDSCLMSMEVKNKNIFSIQYHPESFMTSYGIDIIQNFLKI